MSSESSENLPENTDPSSVLPVELGEDNTVSEESKLSNDKTLPAVQADLASIKLKEEEMMKRISEMEEKKAEILDRIKKMEEMSARADKLREEKLVRIAKVQEREAQLKIENEKLGLRKPKNAEEEAIFQRIVELENRKRAILDRIEDIERVKSKGLEYKERAEKLRQKLEEKRQQQLHEQEKESQRIKLSSDNTSDQIVGVEEAVAAINLSENCDENKNELEGTTVLNDDSKTVETELSLTSSNVEEEGTEHTVA